MHILRYSDVLTAVTADSAQMGETGILANTVESLRLAVEEGKPCLKAIYTRLDDVLSEHFERRFICAYGTYALFLPVRDGRYCMDEEVQE